MKKQIGDMLFSVIYQKSEKVELNQWRNTFNIVLENQNGDKFERGYDVYSKNEKETNVSDELFFHLLSQVFEACYINSESYDSVEEWCWDFGYDENDESSKEEYKESVEIGDSLLKVVSDEWLKHMEVYFKLSEK
jgi:hypothetical protein